MGMASSKVAAVSRSFQTIRPHIPSIKFPSRVNTVSNDNVTNFVPTAVSISSPNPTNPSSSKPIGSSARGTGIEYSDLPSRYHRRLISQDEMEYIEKGGQV